MSEPSTPAGKERRVAERFPPQGWVAKISLPRTFIGLREGEALAAPILDLSETGARLILPKEVQKGMQIRVRLEDPKFKDVVESIARVVWATPPPPVATTWIIGVEFVELPREQRLKIAGWKRFYGSEEFRKKQEETKPSNAP